MTPRKGAYCCYCKRALTPSGTNHSTSFTWDHVRPRSHGGTYKVPCCLTCNNLKGDFTPEQWDRVRAKFPEWWKLFKHRGELLLALRQARWSIAA
jgi:hypothetical protein